MHRSIAGPETDSEEPVDEATPATSVPPAQSARLLAIAIGIGGAILIGTRLASEMAAPLAFADSKVALYRRDALPPCRDRCCCSQPSP
jgi:hypothetical protein